MELSPVDKYRYLELTQNRKNNYDDHFKIVKGKLEGAYQKMMALIGNSAFSGIEMEAIWTVVQACLLPIITYGGETMENTTKNYNTANKLMDNIIKRILRIPKTTPRQALYIETGLLDPETIIKKNRISMEMRIKQGTNQTMKEIVNLTHKGCWAEQNKEIKEKMEVTEELTNESKYTIRKTLQQKARKMLKEKLEETAKDKSKMAYYYEGKNNWNTGNRSEYMKQLSRNQASIIFKARTRMLKIKGNYKNGNESLKCSICKDKEETQGHILEECEKINEIAPKVTKEMIFSEEIEMLKEVAQKIERRIGILENQTSTSL